MPDRLGTTQKEIIEISISHLFEHMTAEAICEKIKTPDFRTQQEHDAAAALYAEEMKVHIQQIYRAMTPGSAANIGDFGDVRRYFYDPNQFARIERLHEDPIRKGHCRHYMISYIDRMMATGAKALGSSCEALGWSKKQAMQCLRAHPDNHANVKTANPVELRNLFIAAIRRIQEQDGAPAQTGERTPRQATAATFERILADLLLHATAIRLRLRAQRQNDAPPQPGSDTPAATPTPPPPPAENRWRQRVLTIRTATIASPERS